MINIVDPLSFPVLTGAALSQAFGFLFGRLAHLLDNRKKKVEPEPVDSPPVLDGHLGPLAPREDALDIHMAELRELAGRLGVYERNPAQLDARDRDLHEALGRLRSLLEDIYGQRITFRGEARPSSGAFVEQQMNIVSGDVTGVRAQRVRQAQVRQSADEVAKDATIIGVQADEIG